MHCNILENWFVHEIIIQSHIPPGVNGWLTEKKNGTGNSSGVSRTCSTSVWQVLQLTCLWPDICFLYLDFNEFGRDIAWYGCILDPQNENDKLIIDQQMQAGNASHPVEEDIDAMQRSYSTIVRTFFNDLMNDCSTNHFTPVGVLRIKSVNIFLFILYRYTILMSQLTTNRKTKRWSWFFLQ